MPIGGSGLLSGSGPRLGGLGLDNGSARTAAGHPAQGALIASFMATARTCTHRREPSSTKVSFLQN